jgi:hypothetical protein
LPDPRAFRPATLLPRALALGLDVILIGCFAALGVIVGSRLGVGQFLDLAVRLKTTIDAAGGAGPDLERFASGIQLAGTVIFGAPIVFAWRLARRGSTPGKAMLALTVRDFATGGAPSFGRALARELLRLAHVPFLFFPNAVVQMLGMALCVGLVYDVARNKASRTWYDRATATIVLVPASSVEGGDE